LIEAGERLRGGIIFILSLYFLITIITSDCLVRVKLNRVNVIGFLWVNCNTDSGAEFATSKVKVVVVENDHIKNPSKRLR
jgi:hypothetical protein